VDIRLSAEALLSTHIIPLSTCMYDLVFVIECEQERKQIGYMLFWGVKQKLIQQFWIPLSMCIISSVVTKN